MLDLNFHPFPELETERLLLRSISVDDAEAIFFLRSDPAVLTYLNKEPAATLKDAQDFIHQVLAGIDENEAILWGIALKEKPETIIGTICIWQIKKEAERGEIGYVLHPAHWKKGLMKEAIGRVVRYAFNDLCFHSLEAQIHPGNASSAASLVSAGFVQEALLRENICFRGLFEDTAIYSLVNKPSA